MVPLLRKLILHKGHAYLLTDVSIIKNTYCSLHHHIVHCIIVLFTARRGLGGRGARGDRGAGAGARETTREREGGVNGRAPGSISEGLGAVVCGAEQAQDAWKGMTDDELDWGADEADGEGDDVAEASALLCSLRRKAVEDGRRLLNGDTCGGQEFCRVNKRQKLALAQVFGASVPEQWSKLV